MANLILFCLWWCKTNKNKQTEKECGDSTKRDEKNGESIEFRRCHALTSKISFQSRIVIPCATENEIDSEAVRILVKMGIKGFFEGANMPITPEAQIMIQRENIVHIPGKAANAGGVALTSVLDLAQDTQGLQWHEEEIERQLEQIMTGIYDQIEVPGVSFVDSANRCGFLKIAYAMKDLGWVYQI